MGSLSSVITPIMNAGTVLGKVANFAAPLMNSNNKYNGQVVDLNNAVQNAAIKKQQNLLNYNNAETERLQRLRQAISTQRARAGVQGTGRDGGSSDAVLDGLNQSSDITRQNNKSQYDLTNTGINQDLANQKQINLLQRQQLKQNTALGFITDNF